MALDILTIPATSDDCERAFSEAGDLLERRRSELRPNIIAALYKGVPRTGRTLFLLVYFQNKRALTKWLGCIILLVY